MPSAVTFIDSPAASATIARMISVLLPVSMPLTNARSILIVWNGKFCR